MSQLSVHNFNIFYSNIIQNTNYFSMALLISVIYVHIRYLQDNNNNFNLNKILKID
jgi:hypothetical protein